MAVLSSDLIRQGASGASTGYTIDQSIRFNKDDSPRMTQTFGTPSDANKWTLSVWSKLGRTGNGMRFLEAGGSAGSEDFIGFAGSAGYEKLYFWKRTSSSYNYNLTSTQMFRDYSAWYHFVYVFDSSNTISTERMKAYVNGQRITDFSTETYPSSGLASRINTAVEHRIGNPVYSSSNHADGYIAEMHFLDGYAYGPEYFGEFEENGIWIPKEYTGSYGNNGFKIDGRDSSDLGDDESGNGNDFTTSGLASNDQKTDTPTNNMITFNPLNNQRSGGSPSNGNLDYVGPGTRTIISLTANIPSTGKWVVAYKVAQVSTGSGWQIGIAAANQSDFGDAVGSNEDLKLIRMQTTSSDLYIYDAVNSTGIDPSLPASTDDEFWVAVDMDSGNVYLGIYDASATSMKWVANDTGLDGNPATGDNPTVTFNTTQMPRDNVVFAVGSKQTSQHIYLQRSTDVSGTTPTGYTYFENVKDLL